MNEITNEEVEVSTVNAEKRNRTLFIINIVVNVIFYFFIFILLMFSISQIRGSSDDKVKNVFGIGYESVKSDSMWVSSDNGLTIIDESRARNTKSSFQKGDLVWVKTLNSKQRKNQKIGNIVTFWDTKDAGGVGFLNTHRIVGIIYNSKGDVSSYILQGDVYRGSDSDWILIEESYQNGDISTEDYNSMLYKGQFQADYIIQVVSPDLLRAKYTGHWDNAGSFVNWLSNPKKGFIFVIFIAAGFLIFEMFMVIKNVMAIKSEKLGVKADAEKEALKEEMAKSLEDERERIRAELLAELQAKQAQENKAAELSTEEENQVENNEEPDVDEDSLEATIDENDKEDAE